MRTTTSSGLRTLRSLSTVGLTVPLAVVLLSGTALAGDKGPHGSLSSGKPAASSQLDRSPASGGAAGKDKGAPTSGAKHEGAKRDGGKAGVTSDSKGSAGKGTASTGGKPAPAPLTKPQPLSNADKNGTGANPGTTCTHAYCSTRDGSPSQNGNGDGKASGKPCAGCVGKADNKNPRGQAPNGRDRNNGYECDGNKGIGKGNPAHTGCKASDTAPVKVKPTTPKDKDPKGPKDCTAKGNGGNGKGNGGNGKGNGPKCPGTPTPGTPTPGTPDQPVTNPVPPTTPTVVLPIVLDRPSTPPVTQAPPAGSPFQQPVGFGQAPAAQDATVAAQSAAQPTALPFTGGDAALLAQIAVLALIAGSGILYAARTRTPLEQ